MDILLVRIGDIGAVKSLLEQGADINYCDEHKNTALIYASTFTRLDVVQLLLEKGADPNLRNKYGVTALMATPIGYKKSMRIIKLLILYG